MPNQTTSLISLSQCRNIQFLMPVHVILLATACNKVPDYTRSKVIPEVIATRLPILISAFVGFDNDMPNRSVAQCSKVPGQDGMSLVFLHEIKRLP